MNQGAVQQCKIEKGKVEKKMNQGAVEQCKIEKGKVEQ